MLKKKGKLEAETDPYRIQKLKECCDMLLAAGYFRARSPTIIPFDKVVGGIVWAITLSGVDAGVEILFQDNSTIGDRIKLSDILVNALTYMKSPIELQPHQIQGLDYDHLYPVLQWLVRKVIENKRLTGDLVRKLSVFQFAQEYEFPEEKLSTNATDYVLAVQDRYKPTRKFKKLDDAKFTTLSQRAEATLLEYGERVAGAVYVDEEKQDRKREREEQKTRSLTKGKTEEDQAELEAAAKARQEEELRIEQMKSQLSATGAAVQVSGGSVGNILTMQAEEIRKAAEKYDEEMKKQSSKAEAEGGRLATEKLELQTFERQVEAWMKKIKIEEGLLEKKIAYHENIDSKMQEVRGALTKKRAYHERIATETAKLDELEQNAVNKELLTRLKQLVFLNESLKAQEAQFKANCQQQRAHLLQMIKELEEGEGDAESVRISEVYKLCENDQAKLQKARELLAAKNQEIAKITRAIDETPTRSELLQYERRFIELYELVQDKLVETRKYYEIYNTLNESFQYMTNEDNLLNSIIDGFPKAQKSSQKAKESFLASFQGILQNVNANKDHVEKERAAEAATRDALNHKYASLLEGQRNYFKAVKEFQEECVKNEKLTEALQREQAAQ